MKQIRLFAVAAFLLIALLLLNRGIGPHGAEQDDASAAANPAQVAPNSKSSVQPAPLDEEAATLLEPETAVNTNPERVKLHMTVGWVFDAANQADPTELVKALSAVQRFASMTHGRVSAEIVNLDVPTEERSPAARAVTRLGLAVNGRTVFSVKGKKVDLSDNPGAGRLTEQGMVDFFEDFPLH